MKHFFFSSILLLMTTVSFSQCTVTGGTIAASQTICNGGDPAAFTESLGSTGSGTLTYTWKHSTDNYAATLGTFSTYDVPSGLTAFTTYRRITTNTIGNLTCTATSNDLIVSIGVTAATIASPQTICNGGDPAAFTVPVASTGFGTLSYDWKHSTDNYAATLGTSSTYDVPSGLTASTTYRLITTGTVGSLTCTANSNDIVVTVNQGAPAAPIATAASNFTCTSMNANWGAVSGATQYFLDLATDAAFTTFVIGYNDVNVGNVFTYNFAALSSNTTYYYRVRADNGCSISLNSNTISTAGGGTNAPIATAASNFTCTSMNANWGAVSGATQYFLDVATDAAFTTFVSGYNDVNVGNFFTYNIVGLLSNTIYYYRVRADNGCSISLNSNTISVTTSSNAPIAAAASNFTCTSMTANWGAVSGATQYFLDVATDNLFANFVAGYSNLNVGNVNAINVTGLIVYTTYYYRVRADNACSTSLNSNTITFVLSGVPAVTTATPLLQTICSGDATSISLSSSMPGTSFTWTVQQTGTTGASAGSGTSIGQTLYATGSANGQALYAIIDNNACATSLIVYDTVTVFPTPTLSSSLTPPAIFTGNVFNYVPTSATAGATFTWTRATVTGISNLANSGTANPNEILTNTAGSPVNVTYIYTVIANGCTNATTYSVVVTVNPYAVWPGDANNDSLVNNTDLLSVGLFYSQTGVPRASISNTWQAYISNNWGTLQTNGQDIKHADCNGDGVIDGNDTLAINSNFNLTHVITTHNDNNNNEIRAISDIYFVINDSVYNAGDWVNVEVWLGSSTAQINSLYGISFNIHYDASIVQSATESITYPASWLGTPGINTLKIAKFDGFANTAYGAITRIDQNNANGFGKIADFKFKIKTTLTSVETMHMYISDYMAVDAAGLTQLFTSSSDSIEINQTVGIQEANISSGITIAPNPFTSQTTISFTTEVKNAAVKIIDIVGKEVKNITFSGSQLLIEKGELNAGIYFVQVVSEKKIIANEKIIIQ